MEIPPARTAALVVMPEPVNELKISDHAEYCAEQTEQRRHGGDGAKDVDVAFQFMDDPGGRLFNALLHDLATMLGIGQTGGEDFTQRRIGAQLLEFLLVELLVLDPASDLPQQMLGGDATGAQGPQAFGNDAECSDGTQNDRQHHPAAGFDQFPHSEYPLEKVRHFTI